MTPESLNRKMRLLLAKRGKASHELAKVERMIYAARVETIFLRQGLARDTWKAARQ